MHPAANRSIPNENAVCVNSRQWSTPTMLPGDCITAAMQFNYKELVQQEKGAYEFVPAGAINRSRLPVERTPRKYAFKSCTMAIANLGIFRPGEVPGLRPSKPLPQTDVGNYAEIVRLLPFLLCAWGLLYPNFVYDASGTPYEESSTTAWSHFAHQVAKPDSLSSPRRAGVTRVSERRFCCARKS